MDILLFNRHPNLLISMPLLKPATQNYWRWGFALGHPSNAKICVCDTNMLVYKNAKICVTPNANAKICVTPNAKPQRESVEYRLCWVPNAKFSRWPCRFHVVYPFFLCWVPNANAVLSGIWALDFSNFKDALV